MRQMPDLVRSVSGSLGISENQAADAVDAVLKGILRRTETDEDEMLVLRGFGTFKFVHRKASKTRNPRTGDPIDVPASKRLIFKQSKGKKP